MPGWGVRSGSGSGLGVRDRTPRRKEMAFEPTLDAHALAASLLPIKKHMKAPTSEPKLSRATFAFWSGKVCS